MSLALNEGGPTDAEIERVRLILSTYQDGSGMLIDRGRNLPGWRDFERTVAQVFGGRAVESKAVFDVEIPFYPPEYGVSCKMRSTLSETQTTGRVTVELSNSAAKFTAAFAAAGITDSTFRSRAADAGLAILSTVSGWHAEKADTLDLERSSHLVLSYIPGGDYQLHQFSVHLPNPDSINWSFPDVVRKSGTRPGKRLQGEIAGEKIVEFYYGSGGQLKYYPRVQDAIWVSPTFRLQPLVDVERLFGPEEKAAAYFPTLWKATG